MNKSYPILFNAPMVRSILDGSKTQTRRVMKPQPAADVIVTVGEVGTSRGVAFIGNVSGGILTPVPCPYGATGDTLWVWETWAPTTDRDIYAMRADGDDPGPDGKWHPSIFMPRRASRITLAVTGVRVERLQEITWQESIEEGIPYQMCCVGVDCGCGGLPLDNPRDDFPALWDSTNAKRGYSWESDPWVWVVEFERVAQ